MMKRRAASEAGRVTRGGAAPSIRKGRTRKGARREQERGQGQGQRPNRAAGPPRSPANAGARRSANQPINRSPDTQRSRTGACTRAFHCPPLPRQ
ncbi:hypothetical protein DM53_4520 [Burkholderia mallei]|nr:hypothetical protein DM53_4520 [Burkholderia mallei]